MPEVIPAIIPNTFQMLRSEMEQVKDLVPRVQVDIIDGQFVPEPTWPYNKGREAYIFDEIIAGDRGFPHWENLQFEIDLMASRPELIMDDWINAGASAIIIHADSTENFAEIAEKLHNRGVEVGLALKPSNPNEISKTLAGEFDFLQIMGNDKIGYHGVELDPLIYEKLENLRAEFPELPIGVDIGVDFETAPKLVEVGATRLVSGSAIFESDDASEAITKLESA